MHDLILKQLDDDDDAELWQVVLDSILAEMNPAAGTTVEIGRCSHWLRPNQSRWTADGGFALPVGYGGSGWSRRGLPLFDWSVVLEWTGQEWAAAGKKSAAPSLRATIPSRTKRHKQAAVHTLRADEKMFRPYGFRRKADGWRLTAVGQPRGERSESSRKVRHGKKGRTVARQKQRREKREVLREGFRPPRGRSTEAHAPNAQ